jgi:glycolate oxidase FAD binding subunit
MFMGASGRLSISSASDADLSFELAERVREATAHRTPLRIVGGDTKLFYGRQVEGERLDIAAHRGVLSYDPTELVVTARAGTPIQAIDAMLAEHGQMLAFEPPVLGHPSTLGGVVASGLAGPRRPFAGAARDFVLGVTVLDGRGDALRLGGTVFKNVAGFDGFRLMAGAHGCLGVLLDISLRVSPRPIAERSVTIDEEWPAAKARLNGLVGRQTPLSAAMHDGEHLHLRFSGSEGGVAKSVADSGGRPTPAGLWEDMRDLKHPLFAKERLWRLSIPHAGPLPNLGGERLIEWAGSQVWLAADAPAPEVRDACARLGGHATLFRGAQPSEEVFTPLAPPLLALHKRIKAAFDPAGVLNPGRMYKGL